MIQKYVKYLVIVGINLLVLTGMLAYWTDSVELLLNEWVRPIEFLKIIGFSLLSLIAIRISVVFFRKKNLSLEKRIKYSVLLTLIISLYLHITYMGEIVQNRIVNRDLRISIKSKIKRSEGLAYGTMANNLSFEEYNEITNIMWFPKVQKEADSISYFYTYDGFLPDYDFFLSYSVKKGVKIDTSEFKYGECSIDTTTNTKVVYTEFVY